MPLFVYRCSRGHEHEWLMKFGESPPTKCPRCGRTVERVVTAPNLKADGAYSYNDGD